MDEILSEARKNGPTYRDWSRVGPNIGVLEESVKQFLYGIGENVDREGLLDTPARVAKAYAECLSGYNERPEDVITMFDNDSAYHGPVILKGAELYSFCEHHFFIFDGLIDIAYQPMEKIIGLSKLLRVARIYAKRLQVQERMTQQIADALNELLNPAWVVVRYEAEHFCMKIRGVRVRNSKTITMAGHGAYPVEIFER